MKDKDGTVERKYSWGKVGLWGQNGGHSTLGAKGKTRYPLRQERRELAMQKHEGEGLTPEMPPSSTKSKKQQPPQNAGGLSACRG